MRLDEYSQLDGLTIVELIKNGEATPEEIADLARSAIDLVNPVINAVVEVYNDVVISGLNANNNNPMQGVPFLIKDTGPLIKGRKFELGSRLCKDAIAEHNTFFSSLLVNNGLSVLGRTNVPEFCIAGTTENVLHGNTSNPWRPGYSTGGSSGGAAAAVAAGMVPIAHGSDIGGSIRIPASLCGCVGLKPSRGRVSAGPYQAEDCFGLAHHFVLTRTIRDTAMMLDCLGVPQPGDPFIIKQPDRPYIEELDTACEPLRIAMSTSLFRPWPVHPDTVIAVEQVAGVLEDMGHVLEEAAPAYDIGAVLKHYSKLWFFGFFSSLDYMAQKQGRKIGVDTLEPCTLAIYESSRIMNPYDFLEAQDYLNSMRRDFGRFFEKYDVWLTPTTAQPAEPFGLYHQNQQGLDAMSYMELAERPLQFTMAYNITGQPAISLPLAHNKDGLPIGIQLGTKHGDEAGLIRLASALENTLPWHERIPELHVSC